MIPKREKRRLTLLPRIRTTTLFIFNIDNTIKSEDIPYFSFVFAILLLNFQLKLCLQFLLGEVRDFLRVNNFQSRPEIVIVTLFIILYFPRFFLFTRNSFVNFLRFADSEILSSNIWCAFICVSALKKRKIIPKLDGEQRVCCRG